MTTEDQDRVCEGAVGFVSFVACHVVLTSLFQTILPQVDILGAGAVGGVLAYFIALQQRSFQVMTFTSYDTWWWPFVFILLGGWLPTGMWRYLGVISASISQVILMKMRKCWCLSVPLRQRSLPP